MTKHSSEAPPPHGFRRLVSVSKVGDHGLVRTIDASLAELDSIGRFLGLVAVRSLTAEVTLVHWRGKGLRVTGTLKAGVTQSCVVTLDPVDARVEAEFERRFLPADVLAKEEPVQHEVFVDPDADDPPEALGREIDLGEVLVEELSLNLDPYPRKTGIEFEADKISAPRQNPFAALAKLKPRLKKKEG